MLCTLIFRVKLCNVYIMWSLVGVELFNLLDHDNISLAFEFSSPVSHYVMVIVPFYSFQCVVEGVHVSIERAEVTSDSSTSTERRNGFRTYPISTLLFRSSPVELEQHSVCSFALFVEQQAGVTYTV